MSEESAVPVTELDKLLDSLRRDRERMDRAIQRITDLPLDEWKTKFPQGNWQLNVMYEASFVLPYDMTLFQPARDYITELGYEISRERQHIWPATAYSEASAGVFMSVKRLGSKNWEEKYEVTFRSERAGTTCKLRQIGKQEIGIYEVVCADAVQS